MDEKYILGLRKGSHADFNKLYDLYADRLYGFAYNLTHSSEMAEEIVQEDFRNRLTLLSYDEYTAQLDAAEEGANTTENDFNFHELNEQILQAKDKLSKRQRTIFEMSREEGLSSQEIALKLDISEQSVRNQLSSALKVLREELIKTGLCFAILFMNQW